MSRLRYAHRILGLEQGFRLFACALAVACDAAWTSIRGAVAAVEVRRTSRAAFRERARQVKGGRTRYVTRDSAESGALSALITGSSEELPGVYDEPGYIDL